MNLTVDVSLDAEARATGRMTVKVQKQMLTMLGINSSEDFQKLLDSDDDKLPAGVSPEVSETDTDFVMSFNMEDVPLMSDDGSFGAVAKDGEVTFTYKSNQSGQDLGDLGGLADMGNIVGSVDIRIEFPGDVVSATGPGMSQPDARTVHWLIPITETATLTATSGISAASGLGAMPAWLLLVLIGLAVAVVVVLLVVFLTRKRGASDQDTTPSDPQPDSSPPPTPSSADTAVLRPPPSVADTPPVPPDSSAQEQEQGPESPPVGG